MPTFDEVYLEIRAERLAAREEELARREAAIAFREGRRVERPLPPVQASATAYYRCMDCGRGGSRWYVPDLVRHCSCGGPMKVTS